ncbi:hypothetical protein BC833DRAFT_582718 [Globomyces pollinis-pini]|nr:hypothetical protein BC833DRAFT_582718 [Globomyces pollinis-pini]
MTEQTDDKESLYLGFREAIGQIINDATDPKNKKADPQVHDVSKLTKATELLLNHGFIDKKTLFQKRRTVWDFICIALDTPDVIKNVLSLTEYSPESRVSVYIQIALMQQSLGTHTSFMFGDEKLLDEWYLPTAILRDPDLKPAILGLLQGLNKLEFNLFIKEQKEPTSRLLNMKSISDFGTALISKGESAIQTGFQATKDTIGHIQTQAIETVTTGVEYLSHHENKSPGLNASEAQISKLEATLMELVKENQKNLDKYEQEHKEKLGLEVELMQLKMNRDKELRRLNMEILKLRNVLKANGLESSSHDNSPVSLVDKDTL